MAHSMFIDEYYAMMGGHVDEITRKRIVCGEYIDFARLLPHDRIMLEDDKRIETVNRDGKMFLMPVTDRDTVINSFSHWEQAFRIFSRIYTEARPGKALELIQYNYTIHSASLSFTWDNVYAYDRDFRMHLSHFPDRSWAIILQQAWTMRLKDQIHLNSRFENKSSSAKKNPSLCWKYNQGKCTFGFNCKFDHKCALCSKFGHGAHNCRRASGGQGQGMGQITDHNIADKSDKDKKHEPGHNGFHGGKSHKR